MELPSLENTAGVVVLYNPDQEVYPNLMSYLGDISVLYCIDNSETKSPEVLQAVTAHPKIKYLDNHGNQGLGQALNLGAQLAIQDSYSWLLTMDQDSRAQRGMISSMQQGIREKFTQNIGIMAPFHLDKDTENAPAQAEEVKEVEVVMTSGNLLNLEAYAKVGPFKADFFIDYIDYEYCLRLQSFGYKILQARQAILQHQVGDISLNYLLGKRVTASNHSYLRRYYITRNRLAVMSLYKNQIPHYFYQELKDFSKDFLRIILFEKDKIKKLLHIAYGVRDFKAGKFGKFNSK